jgi:hypothetical protein
MMDKPMRGVCSRCGFIYSGRPWHCGCTYRMGALEKVARESARMGHPGLAGRAQRALDTSPHLAATDEGGEYKRAGSSVG